MRISDWSSDVCSSDLRLALSDARIAHDRAGAERRRPARELRRIVEPVRPRRLPARIARIAAHRRRLPAGGRMSLRPDLAIIADHVVPRSEEHTSELQSLMRSSYAFFCLKNKQLTSSHKD